MTESIVITEQRELEKACMEEVDGRSRMSEETPPMTEPLVDLLDILRLPRRQTKSYLALPLP
eukprot:9565554-Ditylum_brightwellii.AAC.1